MAKRGKSLFDLTIDEFDSMIRGRGEKDEVERQYYGKRARLIPSYKKLDELSLASVFLAALPLIVEFRDIVFAEIKMNKSGYLKCYTEVSFPKTKNALAGVEKKKLLRVDGLLLQVVGKKIRDAAIFEFKMGSQKIESGQVNAYLQLAKELGIQRLVTISNQFVPSPTDYPIEVQEVKGVDLYHFSWRHIIALGSILLTDNEYNIEDPDQVKIMEEVMAFLRDPNVQAETFDTMGKGWVELTEGIVADRDFTKKNYPCINEAIRDWIEEEQDLALKMSDELGVRIECRSKGKQTIEQRIALEKNRIVQDQSLGSEFRFPNTVSPLWVTLNLGTRRLFCDVEVQVPPIAKSDIHKRSMIGKQLGFVIRQLDRTCRMRNESAFASIEPSLYLLVKVKGRKANPCKLFKEYEELLEESLNSEIVSVTVSYQIQMGGDVTKRRVFIANYEEHVRTFYAVIVQHLKNFVDSPPRMDVHTKGKNIEEDLTKSIVK
jgi:hypothetical protein